MSVKISNLPAASALSGNELAAIVQGGATKKIAVSNFIQATASAFYARFKIGDGNSGTPANNATSFVVSGLIGKSIDDFIMIRDGMLVWPEDDYDFDSSTGRISLVISGDKLITNERILVK